MREAVIVEAVRTPIGKRNGGLSGMHPADLSAVVLRGWSTGRHRPGVDRRRDLGLRVPGRRPVQQHRPLRGARRRLARDHPGTTVNRACGSSQQALDFAAQAVMSGQHDLVVAGGVEVMSRVPLGAARATGLPVRAAGPGALRRLLLQPGDLRGADRAEVGILARRGSTSSRRAPTSGPPRPRTRGVRRADRAGDPDADGGR